MPNSATTLMHSITRPGSTSPVQRANFASQSLVPVVDAAVPFQSIADGFSRSFEPRCLGLAVLSALRQKADNLSNSATPARDQRHARLKRRKMKGV